MNYMQLAVLATNFEVTSGLTNLIDKFGFSIFCVICCFWYIYHTHEEYRNDYKDLHKTHEQEVTALTNALISNTEVLRSLKDYLDDYDITEKGDK